MTASDRWADLRVRLVSAAILIVVAAADIAIGGLVFELGVALLVGAMIWELARMTGPSPDRLALPLAALAALCLYVAAEWLPAILGYVLVLLPALGLLKSPRRDQELAALYGVAIMIAGMGLVGLRAHGGMVLVWLVSVVVITDTLGYFAGRFFGGPKFWPQISPKKTWSGTVAGWLGAALVGLGFGLFGTIPWAFALLSAVFAFSGQLGDIAESWLKRRAGVKDSSGLIPGHGGVMDRFDALIGAVLAVQLVTPFVSGFS